MGTFFSFYMDQVIELPSLRQVYASTLSLSLSHTHRHRHRILCDSLFPILPVLYKTSL